MTQGAHPTGAHPTDVRPAETRRGPEPPDLTEKGGMRDGQPQRSDASASHDLGVDAAPT
jgi:hypothetical protein